MKTQPEQPSATGWKWEKFRLRKCELLGQTVQEFNAKRAASMREWRRLKKLQADSPGSAVKRRRIPNQIRKAPDDLTRMKIAFYGVDPEPRLFYELMEPLLAAIEHCEPHKSVPPIPGSRDQRGGMSPGHYLEWLRRQKPDAFKPIDPRTAGKMKRLWETFERRCRDAVVSYDEAFFADVAACIGFFKRHKEANRFYADPLRVYLLLLKRLQDRSGRRYSMRAWRKLAPFHKGVSDKVVREQAKQVGLRIVPPARERLGP